MVKIYKVKTYESLITLLILLISISQFSAAEEAKAIEISLELSITECYPGDALWVNGTARYDNSTPIKDSEVIIYIIGTEMEWTALTDSNGDYEKQITAIGRYIDQQQPDVSESTDYINVSKRVGQTFMPNASEIQSIDIHVFKFFASSSSYLTVHIRTSPSSTTDIGNATLYYDEIEDGWNNFAFPSPLEVIPGNSYFILLTSNSTGWGYLNLGRPFLPNSGSDYYVNGTVYWEGNPMVPDPDQDIGFIFYYDEPLQPSEYPINVNITGTNSTGTLYGYNETILTVVRRPIADLHLTDENLSLIHVNDPPLEGDTIFVNATIRNQGDAPATDFLINFSMDFETCLFDSQSITLDAFQTFEVSAIWIAEAGDHTIFVTADSSDIIAESLEANNNASFQIFVDGDNDNDGIGNISDVDDDNDGYPDAMEISEGTNPLDGSSKPADNDGDFIPDSIDPDDDNDGYSDVIESTVGTNPFDNSSVPDDYDKDGIPDSLDSDIDNDGIPNDEDKFPYNCSEWLDTDDDGIGNNADHDDDADGKPDDEDIFPLDTDDDNLNNDIDWDDDADGILDWEDSYPLDTDNDGLRNDVDADDDGDGLTDLEEEKKHTNPLKWDTDGDGVNDKKDFDPLDSEVTSDPGFPILYLIIPGLAVLVLILFAFLVSRRGAKIKVTGVGEGYKELPVLGGVDESSAELEVSKEYLPSSKLAEPMALDELEGLEEEIEEPRSQPIKDELADIEEEFEEPLSSKDESAGKKEEREKSVTK